LESEYKDPPLHVGDEIEMPIEGFGDSGDAFIRKNGYVVFIKDCEYDLHAGDLYCVKVTKVTGKVGFGVIVE